MKKKRDRLVVSLANTCVSYMILYTPPRDESSQVSSRVEYRQMLPLYVFITHFFYKSVVFIYL